MHLSLNAMRAQVRQEGLQRPPFIPKLKVENIACSTQYWVKSKKSLLAGLNDS